MSPRHSVPGCGLPNGRWISVEATFRARLAGMLAFRTNRLIEGGVN